MRELPQLNESRCTGCGDCIEICPSRCLERMDSVVWLPRPRECISCRLCVIICPEEAMRLAPWVPA